MLKTLAKDIIAHPQEWTRSENCLERSLTSASRGLGTAKIDLFTRGRFSINVNGYWYRTSWLGHRALKKAKKFWLKYHFNVIKDTWKLNAMTTEEWFEWRQSQVDKK